jgi:hypothetical protein
MLTRLRASVARWTRAPAPPTMPDVDERPVELWTVRRLAEWLGVSHQAVADKIDRGRIVPHYQALSGNGWVYLFDPARVKRWRKTGA